LAAERSLLGNPMTLLDAIWTALGEQLRHPSGRWGRVVGHAMSVANRRPNRLAIEALKLAPADIVLELGFGPGWALAELVRLAPRGHVLGIDQSAAMLIQARRRNHRAIGRGQLDLRRGRFDALPWPTASIDKILAVNVGYFFGCDGAEIREARRVLRPGGALVVYATDRSTMSRWKFAGAGTHRQLDADVLAGLLVRAGFAAPDIRVDRADIGFGVRGIMARASTPANRSSGAAAN